MSAKIETVRDEHHRCTYHYHVGRPAICKKCGTTGLVWMRTEYDTPHRIDEWSLMYTDTDGQRYNHVFKCGTRRATNVARARVENAAPSPVKVGDRVTVSGHLGTVERLWRPTYDVWADSKRIRFARGELAVKIKWDERGKHRLNDWQRAANVRIVEEERQG